jgi:hypothetical protein
MRRESERPRQRVRGDSAAAAANNEVSDTASDDDGSGRRSCDEPRPSVPEPAGERSTALPGSQKRGKVVVAAISIGIVAFAVLAALKGGGNHDARGGHDSREAILRAREQALTAALDAAFEKDKASVLPRSFEAGMQIVRQIVHETLQRRERQLQMRTIKRAVTFHFAGDLRDQENSNQTSRMFAKVAGAIEKFVFSDHTGRSGKAPSALHIGNGSADWHGARKRVADYLSNCPNAVVVIHNADKAPDNSERLYDLEDAFEMPHLQNEGVQIGITSAVFILQTSLGPALTHDVCGGLCDLSHR